jgi:hypothetical protein
MKAKRAKSQKKGKKAAKRLNRAKNLAANKPLASSAGRFTLAIDGSSAGYLKS